MQPLPWIADRLLLTCSMEAHMTPRPRRVDRWVEANVGVDRAGGQVVPPPFLHRRRQHPHQCRIQLQAANLGRQLRGIDRLGVGAELDRLIAEGRVSPPTRRGLPPPLRLDGDPSALRRALDEIRGER